MATVEASIDVGVPISAAYDQWTQFEEFPRFMNGVVDVKQLDDTTTRWIADINGHRHEWDAEIVEQRPDRLIAWQAVDDDEHSGRVTFEQLDDGTRVSVSFRYATQGVVEPIGALLGIDEQQVLDDLERFKQLVEGREVPTGSWRGTIENGVVVDDGPTIG